MIKLRLRELREKIQLTQQEVASRLGISRVRYNQYETGRRYPDYELLVKLSQLFSCSVDFLLTSSEGSVYSPENQHAPSEHIIAADDAISQDLRITIAEAKSLYNITDEDIKDMIEIAKKLKGAKKRKK